MMSPRVVFVVFAASYIHLILVDHPFFGFVPIPEDGCPSLYREVNDLHNKLLHAEELPESLDWRNYKGNQIGTITYATIIWTMESMYSHLS